MNAGDRSFAGCTSNQSTAFYQLIAIAHRHAVNLTNAINQLQFMNAWLGSMDLARSLNLATLTLGKLSESDRAEPYERLASLCSVAHRLQAMAPRPSDTAIAQGRSKGIPANRNAWEFERRAWIAERRTQGRIVISSGPDGLTLSSGGDA